MILLSHDKRSGFSLVELMVSVAISSAMLIILVGIASKSAEVTRSVTQQMAATSTASAALDLIAADLQSLASSTRAEEFLQAVPDPSAPINGSSPMWLMINSVSRLDSTATVSGNSISYPDSSLVRAISYRIAWQDPLIGQISTSPESNIFGLYRSAAPKQSTFDNALGIQDLQNSFWKSRQITRPEDFVAANIIDLQIAFYRTGNATATNVSGSGLGPVRISGINTMVNGTLLSGSRLTQAEISVTILEDVGARLWGNGSGTDGQSPTVLRKKYGRTFTRRVWIRLAP